jgi:ectoine hydroxylase-related dioxygenase (phytanoyl-CoA dioxygenase family)
MTGDAATHLARLFADGYCIVRQAIDAETIGALERELEPRFAATPFCEGGFYGARTKRFGALLKRGAHAQALVRHKLVLQIVDAVLKPWCDRFVLNLTQAVELHPGALAQIPHRDHDLWGGIKGTQQYQVNVVWPLTAFTAENGATVIWPGSHNGIDPDQTDDAGIAAEMAPGDALLFLGSTLHGGGANMTDGVRRAVIVGYCLGWLRTFENQYLAYPPEVARDFDAELAALVGYSQHRPNLGNVEGQCPSVLLQPDVPNHLAAIDALKPEQADMLADYVADQEAARAGLAGG